MEHGKEEEQGCGASIEKEENIGQVSRVTGGFIDAAVPAKGPQDLIHQGPGSLLVCHPFGSMILGKNSIAYSAITEGAKNLTSGGHAVEESLNIIK